MFGFRKRYPGNGRPVTTWVYGPDIHSMRIAGLGHMTNTLSPGSVGTHLPPDASRSGFTGDPGYGVNRWAGETLPVQHFFGLVAPIAHARGKLLGIGAGVAGQPGLPNTGTDAGDTSLYGFAMPSTAGWGS